MPDNQLNARLGRVLERQVELLEKTGDGLARALVGCDVPDRDWCRVYGHHYKALGVVLTERRESAKLQLLREKLGGAGALSDDDYQLGLAELATEAIAGMEPDLLAKALAVRGLTVVPVEEGEDE